MYVLIGVLNFYHLLSACEIAREASTEKVMTCLVIGINSVKLRLVVVVAIVQEKERGADGGWIRQLGLGLVLSDIFPQKYSRMSRIPHWTRRCCWFLGMELRAGKVS